MNKDLYLNAYNLNTHPNLDVLEFTDEQDWEQIRRKGIGGSDVGAIIGLNEYTSPLQIYKAKVEDIKTDLSKNVNVRKGKDLEPVIRTNYVFPEFKKLGYIVKKVDCMLINTKYPWIRANLDGIAIKEDSDNYKDNIIIEIKFVSEWGETKWNGDDYFGIPASYYAQVQTYMLVTGAKKAVVCALFESSWEVKYYTIPRDEEFISDLIKKTQLFYEYHMLMKIPPAFKTGIDKEDIIEVIDTPKECYTDKLMDSLVSQYKQLDNDIKRLTEEKNTVKENLVNRYLDGGRGEYSPDAVKVTHYMQTKFDTTKFKKDFPEMYDNYSKQNECLKVTIK